MKIAEALDFIRNTDGKIFSVKFRKRTTGEVRQMTCRTGVKSRLAENPTKPGIDFKKNDLIAVFDMQADGYRSIPIEGIFEIKMDGEWVPVVHRTRVPILFYTGPVPGEEAVTEKAFGPFADASFREQWVFEMAKLGWTGTFCYDELEAP